jgi:hypothetical protein
VKEINMTDNNELADLKRELAQVKAAMKPLDPAALEREARAWRNQMHQAAEGRMSRANAFSHDQLAAMEAAVPADMCRDLVRHGTVQGPSAAGSSGQVTKVSSNAGLVGSNTGWRTATPISPPPGVAIADRLMDAQDARDRHERMVEEARRQALLKAAGEP